MSSKAANSLTVSALGLAALVLLTACVSGDASSGAPQGPPSSEVSSGPLPLPTTSASEPTPNLVTPQAAVKLRQHRWDEAAPGGEGSELLVRGFLTGGPPCAVLGRVDVSETDESVTITLWVGQQADAACDGPQPDLAYPFVTKVSLQEALGERRLIDGAA